MNCQQVFFFTSPLSKAEELPLEETSLKCTEQAVAGGA